MSPMARTQGPTTGTAAHDSTRASAASVWTSSRAPAGLSQANRRATAPSTASRRKAAAPSTTTGTPGPVPPNNAGTAIAAQHETNTARIRVTRSAAVVSRGLRLRTEAAAFPTTASPAPMAARKYVASAPAAVRNQLPDTRKPAMATATSTTARLSSKTCICLPCAHRNNRSSTSIPGLTLEDSSRQHTGSGQTAPDKKDSCAWHKHQSSR